MAWLNRFLLRGKRTPGQLPSPKKSKGELVVGDGAFPHLSSSSYRSLLRTAVSDAEQIAASIKDKARSEAEVEAARIVVQARLEVQEIKGKAEITAREEAQSIVSAAEKEAANIELEAREKAFQFLVQTSRAIEEEIREEYRLALSRLSAHLQELSNESQRIDAELKSKLDGLAENKPRALSGDKAALLSTSEFVMSPLEAPVPAEKEEKRSRKKVEPVVGVASSEPSTEFSEPQMDAANPGVLVEEKVGGAVPLPEKIAEKKERKFLSLSVKIPWRRVSPPAQEERQAGAPVKAEEEAVVEKAVSPEPVPEATPIIPEPVVVAQEERHEKHAGKQEEVRAQEPPTLLEVDSQELYTGEVELVIIPPADLKLVSRLYNYLQTIPEVKVLYTRGSWDRGTTIVIALEKPVALIKTITGIPGMIATAGLLGKDGVTMGKVTSLRRLGDRGEKRLGLILKEARGTEENGEV